MTTITIFNDSKDRSVHVTKLTGNRELPVLSLMPNQHTELQLQDGMAILVKEGDQVDWVDQTPTLDVAAAWPFPTGHVVNEEDC